VTHNRGMGPPWGAFCQITLTSCFYYASIYNTPALSSHTKSEACIDVKTPRYCSLHWYWLLNNCRWKLTAAGCHICDATKCIMQTIRKRILWPSNHPLFRIAVSGIHYSPIGLSTYRRIRVKLSMVNGVIYWSYNANSVLRSLFQWKVGSCASSAAGWFLYQTRAAIGCCPCCSSLDNHHLMFGVLHIWHVMHSVARQKLCCDQLTTHACSSGTFEAFETLPTLDLTVWWDTCFVFCKSRWPKWRSLRITVYSTFVLTLLQGRYIKSME